jgi:hypothetical protein
MNEKLLTWYKNAQKNLLDARNKLQSAFELEDSLAETPLIYEHRLVINTIDEHILYVTSRIRELERIQECDG